MSVRTVPPTPQAVVKVSAKQLRAFASQTTQAQRFVASYRGPEVKVSLESLDEAFRRWQLEDRKQFTVRQVVDILGAYLGSRMAADLNMEWVVVTDEDGTSYAVRSKKYEVISFPFASVTKRIDRGEHDFMSAVYYAVAHSIDSGQYKTR